MQRIIKIIVVLLIGLFGTHALQAQLLSATRPLAVKSAIYNRLMQLPADSVSVLNHTPPVQSIPSDYYTRHFGFFCDKELKVEKLTGVPLRFRMGSLESCNRLEGKN